MVLELLFLTAIPTVTGVSLAISEQKNANARRMDAKRMAKFKIVLYNEMPDGSSGPVHGWTLALRRGIVFVVPRGLSVQRERERAAILSASAGGGSSVAGTQGEDRGTPRPPSSTAQSYEVSSAASTAEGAENGDGQDDQDNDDADTVHGDDAASAPRTASRQTTASSVTTPSISVPPSTASATSSQQPLPRTIHEFHGFYIEYPYEEKPPILGLVSSIPHIPPTLGWIYADDRTGVLRYGNRSASVDHVFGRWDWTEDESRVIFRRKETMYAVDMASAENWEEKVEKLGEAFFGCTGDEEWGLNEEKEMRWRVFWDALGDGLVKMLGPEENGGFKRVPLKWFRAPTGEPIGT